PAGWPTPWPRARPDFSSSAPRAARWWMRCAAPWASGATRRAGGRSSAPGCNGISAGRQPLVATPLSTRGLPRRVERRGAPRAPARLQRRVVLAADRPTAVPQVEARARAHRVLLRGGEGAQRADVAPVGALLEVAHARDVVAGEVVGV